jgi:AcrR family transcriptional regulator
MRQTPLAQLLTDGSRRPDALTAFKITRAWFVEGRRIEMQELARELGVSRATLFRWVGSRDDLLTEVIWSVTTPTLERAEKAATEPHGGARVAEIMELFCQTAIDSGFFQTFLQREPERALRLLTTRAMPFQGNMVRVIEEIIEREAQESDLDSPLSVHDLAFLIVRICESFIYSDLITGEPPNAAKVRQAITALLRP